MYYLFFIVGHPDIDITLISHRYHTMPQIYDVTIQWSFNNPLWQNDDWPV